MVCMHLWEPCFGFSKGPWIMLEVLCVHITNLQTKGKMKVIAVVTLGITPQGSGTVLSKIPLLILKLFNFPACLCKPVCWSYSDSFRTGWNVPRPCWDGLSCCRAFQHWSLAGKVRLFGSALGIQWAWLFKDLQVFYLRVEGFTLFIFH